MTDYLNNKDFFACCKDIILTQNIDSKCSLTKQLYIDWKNNFYQNLSPHNTIDKIEIPGRPECPVLIDPIKVAKRRIGTVEGIASLIHAITHIEFNAINLALDACYRFQNMPFEYYENWLEVANDEVYHFQLLCNQLEKLGYHYGSFNAHNGLWDMAVRTDHDVLLRMALVPRVLEARGIDAIPEIERKLSHIKDDSLQNTLSIIHRDEIKHVAFGDYWFKYECHNRKLNPEQTFLSLIQEYNAPKIRGAFNRDGRKLAGFSDTELDAIAP